MTSGGNNFKDFAESQLTTFRAFFHPDGYFRYSAVVIIGLMPVGLPE